LVTGVGNLWILWTCPAVTTKTLLIVVDKLVDGVDSLWKYK
jgi:hypothetical protein